MVPYGGVQPEVVALAAAASVHKTKEDVRGTQKQHEQEKERTACGGRGDGWYG